MSLNKIIIMGHITRDPELKDVGSTKVCKFGVATNRKFKNNQGERQEETCFIDVQAWGKQAEIIAQYFSKGKPILVEGRLKFEQWERDGKQNSKHVVQLESFDFIPKNGDTNNDVDKTLKMRTPVSRTPVSRTPVPRRPNETTMRSINNVEQRKNLSREFSTADELIDDLPF